MEQVSILTDTVPKEVYMDRGYRGHQHPGKTRVILAGQKRGITKKQHRRLKRRNTIEPIIGHMKADGKLKRCYLKGQLGDTLNVVLSAVGQNIRKLLKRLATTGSFIACLLHVIRLLRETVHAFTRKGKTAGTELMVAAGI